MTRWLDRVLLVFAAVVATSIGLAAWRDTSQAWDVWYYHLPFAARLLGIVDDDAFVFSPMNQARYAGFPLGAEILQGLAWRITGRPEAANLVAFGSVPLFALLLRRKFDLQPHHVVLATFAVPLVQTHATSCYVDLPANVGAAGLVLIAARAWSQPERSDDPRLVALAVVLGTIAAHMRFQLAPVVLVALIALGLRLTRRTGIALVAALPLVYFWPLKNLVRFGNPAFPVELRMGPLILPGLDTPYEASPPWLENAPKPLRFAASVLEIGARSLGDPMRWTVDQWTPPDHDGYRMGGFFGAYVVFLLGVVAIATFRRRRDLERAARARLVALAVLTVVIAVSPQSHELRYYLVWMLVLVATALLAVGPAARVGLAAASAGFLIVVVFVTRGAYARPSGDDFEALVKRRVDPGLVEVGRARGRVCVTRPPWSFLHAAPFHPGGPRYVVVEADTAAECPAP